MIPHNLTLKEEYEETRLGREAIQKMISDLESGNVQIYECTITDNFEALLTAAGVGSNTTGIIYSCINFLTQTKDVEMARNFGTVLSGLGILVGTSQTCIAVSDGDITTGETLSAISTALAAAGFVYGCCGAFPIAGVLGVSSGVVGLISTFFTNNFYFSTPTIIHIKTASNQNIYLLYA